MIKEDHNMMQSVQTEELQKAAVETNAARNRASDLQKRLDEVKVENEINQKDVYSLRKELNERTESEKIMSSKLRKIAKQNVVMKDNSEKLKEAFHKQKEKSGYSISKLKKELNSLGDNSGRENQYFLSQLQTAQTHVENERIMRRALQEQVRALEEENRNILEKNSLEDDEGVGETYKLLSKQKLEGTGNGTLGFTVPKPSVLAQPVVSESSGKFSLDYRLANLARTISSFDDESCTD